ncbi:uncharacterized protein BJ171DRAFT_441477 [Polychytrium aggregatum]|uniref:uncharacterized protein n=1 Tax=Polychytrium aggregatum TaxID=110093 RepID=UPI0022FF20C0|nr:uncharacterized protein BJ171DRAFT_441477 [Polychytrium aggregatum]KAI9205267.1 hypothetical protein BJ171DRAFT_441477 [Polychytrium aggregatum]
MPPKKKKSKAPSTRGYATTSIPSKPAQLASEATDTLPDTQDPSLLPEPIEASDAAALLDSTLAVEASYFQAAARDAWEDPDEIVLASNAAASTGLLQTKVESSYRQAERARLEAQTSEILPKLKLESQSEHLLMELARQALDERDWFLPEAKEKSSTEKLHLHYCLLERMGFQKGHIQEAMTACGGMRLESLLDWLCIHVRSEDLPAGFFDNILHDGDTSARDRRDADRVATSQCDNQAVHPRPHSPAPPPKDSVRREEKDLKSWILQQASRWDLDEDEDDLVSETSQEPVSTRHAKLKYELEQLLAEAQRAKSSKDVAKAKQLGTSIGQLRQAIRILEDDDDYDVSASSRAFKQLLDEKQQQPREPERESSRQPPSPDASPRGHGDNDEAEDQDEEDGGMLGMFDEDTESAPPGPTTLPPTTKIRDMSVAKWSGHMPKDLLAQWLNKNARGAKASYHLSRDGVGYASTVRLSGHRLVEGKSFEMADRAAQKDQASHFVSVIALYALSKPQQYWRQLPQPYADLWRELEAKENEVAQKHQHGITQERGSFVGNLVKQRDVKLEEHKSSLQDTGLGDELWHSPARGDMALPTFAKVDPQTLLAEFSKRKSRRGYQKLLADRSKLPVYLKRKEILDVIRSHQVVIVSGETGSGKSTQIPQFILEDLIETKASGCYQVLCTQPRRISATSIASRVSEEIGDPAGGVGAKGAWVGYQIRLESKVSPTTRLTFCTTGVLLRRLESNPTLDGVTHIVVDEVHERSMDSDFLLILLRRLLNIRPDMRLILMSATADSAKFQRYFESNGLIKCPGINVAGRTFPVETFYLEDAIEQTNFVIDPDSEYARKPVVVRQSAGKVGITVRGGKRINMSLEWDEEVYDDDQDDDSITESISTSDDVDRLPQYTKKTLKTVSAMDPYRLNLDLVEALVRHVCRVASSRGQSGGRDDDKDDWEAEVDDAGGVNGADDANADRGSILVFLPGLAEIRKLHERLSAEPADRQNNPGPAMEVLPLHSTLGSAEQARVFLPPPKGKQVVVLATNIAETGITIPHVRYVIDTVRAREISYDERRNMTRLKEIFVAKANCKQRRGRAGRVSEGICYHLIARGAFEQLPDHRPPELTRLPLEEMCLRARAGRHSDSFYSLFQEALDPPPRKNVDKAIAILQQVQAIDSETNLTALGYRLAQLPVDCRLGKTLLFAVALRCLDPILTVCAALFMSKSPFLRPFGKEAEADQARATFRVENSDLLSIASAMSRYRDIVARGAKSGFSIQQECSRAFLNATNCSQIEDAKEQLLRLLIASGTLPLECRVECRSGSLFSVLPPTPGIYNHNSTDNPILLSVLTVGLFPNFVYVRKEIQGPLQTRPQLHRFKTPNGLCCYALPSGEAISIHRYSLNSKGIDAAGGGVYVFYEAQRNDHSTSVWDINRANLVASILFNSSRSVQHWARVVMLGDSDQGTMAVRLQCSPRTAVLLRCVGDLAWAHVQATLGITAFPADPKLQERGQKALELCERILAVN